MREFTIMFSKCANSTNPHSETRPVPTARQWDVKGVERMYLSGLKSKFYLICD